MRGSLVVPKSWRHRFAWFLCRDPARSPACIRRAAGGFAVLRHPRGFARRRPAAPIRARARPHPRKALQPAHRAGLRRLDSTLHPLSRQAAPADDGGGGGRGVPVASGGRAAGGGVHAEPGARRRCCSSTGEVLGVELPWLDGVVQAKAPQRLPVVLTRDEVRALLRRLDGVHRLVGCAALRHRPAADGGAAAAGEGRRLRAPRDRRARRQGRQGPGDDAAARACRGRCARSWLEVRALHAAAISTTASARCGCRTRWRASTRTRRRDWGWQYVFPARDAVDRSARRQRCGATTCTDQAIQRAVRQAARAAGHRQAGDAAHAAPLVRHAPAASRATTSARCRSCSATPT